MSLNDIQTIRHLITETVLYGIMTASDLSPVDEWASIIRTENKPMIKAHLSFFVHIHITYSAFVGEKKKWILFGKVS